MTQDIPTERPPRIAFLISWPREIDMFAPLITLLGSEVALLVDDLSYSEPERANNAGAIIALLKKQNRRFYLLTEAIREMRFALLVSTGLSFFEVRTVRSLFKFVYALSVGVVLEATGLAGILETLTGRRFSAGGIRAESFERKQPERQAASFVVRYPKGLDLSRKYYPEARWAGVYDLHLCHGDIDSRLIRAKFPDANCLKIGYPKYAGDIDGGQAMRKVRDEFGIKHDDKPLLLWMPTHLKAPGETGQNIMPWLQRLERLLDSCHILVRIHPKTVVVMPELEKDLETRGFFIDLKRDRELRELYAAADCVLADFGASVLSAICMQKQLVLLGFEPLPNSVKKIENAAYLDLDARGSLPVVFGETRIRELVTEFRDGREPNTLGLRHEYFGSNEEIIGLNEIAATLLEKCGDIRPSLAT